MRMLILVSLTVLLIPAQAQVENTLTQAKGLVTRGHSEEAITLLNQHLSEESGDTDARVLLGLICSWEKHWDEGRRAFSLVLQSDPDYKDAVLGLINLEIWSGHLDRAEELVHSALAARPEDKDYKLAFAKVQ